MLMFLLEHRSYFILLGGFLIHLPIGGYYSSGNIQPYLVEYMRNHSVYGNTVTSGNTVWIFGLLAFGMGTAVSLGGYLEKRIGPALTTLIGGWIMSLNVCLAYFTIKTYLAVVILSYGLLAGIGAGLCYGVAFGTACKWFPNNRGLVIGIVVSGLGISQTIFIALQKCFFSIDGKMNLDGLPMSFVYLGGAYAVVQLLGALLLKLHVDPWRVDSIQSDSDVYPNLFSSNKRQPSSDNELKPHQLLLEFDFWILWLTYILNSSSIPICTSLRAEYGRYIGLSDNYTFGDLTIVNMIGGFFNFAGRIFFGFLIDRKPYKVIMIVVSLTNSVFMGTFLLLDYASHKPFCIYLFGFWVSLLNFFQGGIYSIFPSICAKLFGLKHFVSNYGLLFTSNSVSGTIISVLAMIAGPGGNMPLFIAAFLTGCVMSFLAAGLTLLFRGRSLIVYKY